jgi:hypothetical protein
MPRKYAAESKPLLDGQPQFVANGALKNQKKSYLLASGPAFFAIHGLFFQMQRRTSVDSALPRVLPGFGQEPWRRNVLISHQKAVSKLRYASVLALHGASQPLNYGELRGGDVVVLVQPAIKKGFPE